MKQKGLAPILIILLIAAATFGYLIYSQNSTGQPKLKPAYMRPTDNSGTMGKPNSSDETSNWKTYTYKNDEFSFKYPNDWYIDENVHSAEETQVIPLKPESIKNNDYPIIFFKTSDKKDPTFMEHKGNEQLIVSIRYDQTFDQLQKQLKLDYPITYIGGKKALKYATGAYILLGPTDKRILSVYRPEYGDNYLDQILSTFKFQ